MTGRRYGVICHLPGKKKGEVVLVTRKSRKEWILPKGRRIAGKSGSRSALREAYEEGGLKGRVFTGKKAEVTSTQNGKKVRLTLYYMRIDKLLKRWPERGQRKRVVVSHAEAVKLVSCSGMRRGLKRLGKG
ncbi:NUDIX hydrolase [Paracoccus sp. (in: a-proteobacteria)]|uniref:NUDIX hydrolase n=1 Tax=Paracoccus sp. TaxID=267 RepID=UPI0035AEEEB3